MKKYFLLFSSLFLLTCMPEAQENKADQLAEFVEQTLKALPGIPGLSVAVVDENGPIFTKGFGYANVEKQIPSTAQTSYYIASTTKSFNGLLATILEAEGKLVLNKKITEYLPFKDFSRKDIFEDITVMDLLSHQSGIENPYISMKLAYTGDFTRAQIISLIEKETQANEQGKVFEYTNFGYYLLDVLLQAELGKSWKDLLQEKVFSPLYMNHTTAYISKISDKNLAMPYQGFTGDDLQQVGLMKTDKVMHAAGGLVCSAEDAAKFLSFYIQKGKVEGKQVYPEALVKTTYKEQVKGDHRIVEMFDAEGYGTGWRTGKFNDEKVVYHFGGYVGFFTHFSFLPEKKIGVAVMVNHRMGMPVMQLVANYAYDLYLDNKSQLNEVELEKRISELADQFAEVDKRITEGNKKLAERKWQLSLDRQAYTGKFQNDIIGAIDIQLKNNDLIVSMGNLRAIATPYTKDECIRLELIPGRGNVMEFQLEDKKVKQVRYRSQIFSPVN